MFKVSKEMIGWMAITSIIVIVSSLFFFGLRLTGYATTTSEGIINITISPVVSINFTIDTINFGGGSVDLGEDNATIDSTGNVVGGNWTPVTQGFELENVGNINVTLQLKSDKTALEFLGGTNPFYQYNVTNLESGSCIPGAISLGVWNNVNVTGDGDLICNNFAFRGTSNSIRIDLKLVIPSDAMIGAQSDIITATGTSI